MVAEEFLAFKICFVVGVNLVAGSQSPSARWMEEEICVDNNNNRARDSSRLCTDDGDDDQPTRIRSVGVVVR